MAQKCPDWIAADSVRDPEIHARFAIAMKTATNVVRAVRPSDFEGWHGVVFGPIAPKGHAYYAGNFRQPDRHRRCLAQNNHVGGRLGTPCEQVPRAMDTLCGWIRTELKALPPAGDADALACVAGAIAHAVGEFIRIHPFINGNGRMSRMLWGAILGALGLPPQYATVIRPDPPYPQIMAAAMANDVGPIFDAVLEHLAGADPH